MLLYQEIILDNYRHPKNYGLLRTDAKNVTIYSPLCGDVVNMQAKFKDEKIADIKFSGTGCVISQALSSLLTEYAKGKTKSQLRKLDRNFMIKMLGIELGPNRIKCAMLPLEALQKLLI